MKLNAILLFIILLFAGIQVVNCVDSNESSPPMLPTEYTQSGAGGLMNGYSSGAFDTQTGAAKDSYSYFYFSYDDSASTAAVEITKNYLLSGILPSSNLSRPWEFLNYEEFQKNNQTNTGLFDISMGIWKHDDYSDKEKSMYELGVHVSAPTIDKAERKNVVLTLVVDVSGSMGTLSSGYNIPHLSIKKMELLKRGLLTMSDNLKEGDVVNIILFNETTTKLVENYSFNPEHKSYFESLINSIKEGGSTNLNAGLSLGYSLAQKYFDPAKLNRVVMLTDAYANTGQVDSSVIAKLTEINNSEGIYFSGMGYGADFNEAFLDDLTEKGKGAYFSIITPLDSDKAFSYRFMSLINVAARDVRFKLEHPTSLEHVSSASEELSVNPEDVQPTNFSYNTSQYFLESFSTDKGNEVDIESNEIRLHVNYKDPATFEPVEEHITFTIGDIIERDLLNIKDAYTITLLTSLMSGNKTTDEAKEVLLQYFSSYSSTLHDEYRKYIDNYIDLKN